MSSSNDESTKKLLHVSSVSAPNLTEDTKLMDNSTRFNYSSMSNESKKNTTISTNKKKIYYPNIKKESVKTFSPIKKSNTLYIEPGNSSSFLFFLDKYFKISERNSTIGTEIRGGIVTFLTMSYIVLVNPKVLNISGVPIHYAASSTCLSSCIATLIVGILGNLPVGCAPGVGLSAYFSYGMMNSIKSHSDNYDSAYLIGLCIALISGFIVFILTLFNITPFIMERIPSFIKLSTVVGMGLFLTFIGLLESSIIVKPTESNVDTALELGDMTSWYLWLGIFNILLIGVLESYNVSGSLLIGICITSVIYYLCEWTYPMEYIEIPRVDNPLSVIDKLNVLETKTLITGGISFILILIFDVSGCIFGIAKMANLFKRNNTTNKDYIPGSKYALIAASVGTMIAALTGCSPIIVHAESLAGVAVGSKTGLTSIVIAICFGLSIFFGPLFGSIPMIATSPCLLLVGVFMMKQIQNINWSHKNSDRLNMKIAMPAFLTIVMMPFTYSIADGIFFGIGSYIIFYILCGDLKNDIKLYFNKSSDSDYESLHSNNNNNKQNSKFNNNNININSTKDENISSDLSQEEFIDVKIKMNSNVTNKNNSIKRPKFGGFDSPFLGDDTINDSWKNTNNIKNNSNKSSIGGLLKHSATPTVL